MSPTINPIALVWPVRKLLAMPCGVYPELRTASQTRFERLSDTRAVPLSVADTVAIDTPASRATSLIVAIARKLPAFRSFLETFRCIRFPAG
jgi:hypothetical protein